MTDSVIIDSTAKDISLSEQNSGKAENETVIGTSGYHHARILWSQDSIINLQFEKDGVDLKCLLTDSFPYSSEPLVQIDTLQMNEVSGKELIITITSLRETGGWGERTAESESYDVYYVYDVDNERLLFDGTSHNYFLHLCADSADENCRGIEYGYYYGVEFSPSAITIDSAVTYGDTRQGETDHPPGRYEWHDGMFVRMSEGK